MWLYSLTRNTTASHRHQKYIKRYTRIGLWVATSTLFEDIAQILLNVFLIWYKDSEIFKESEPEYHINRFHQIFEINDINGRTRKAESTCALKVDVLDVSKISPDNGCEKRRRYDLGC